MAVNDQCAVYNLHTGCKMMRTICKKWTHSRCCYVTYDNFAMCLPRNHTCFRFSEISNIELLDLFFQLQKLLLQHLMKPHFHLLNLMYITTI